jgi:lactate racemase
MVTGRASLAQLRFAYSSCMAFDVHLSFGKQGLKATLPDGFDYTILEARSATPLAHAEAAIADALDGPVECPPLKDLANGKQSAAISVCDITRPTPNRIVLPHLLRRLETAGISRSNIRILIATGLHRGATPAEINEIVGPEIAGQYAVENHDARDLASHRHLGATPAGTPVYIDERFVSADLRITLGFIEPHLMAGFSGGRKLVVPGLAAQETIKVLHSPKFMREPRAVEGSIETNPLHRELVEIAGMAGHRFMVDVSLARDRSIAGVFAGDPVAAHRRGVEFVSRALLEELPHPVDAVITTSAGYPLDLTYYQSIKGITAAAHIVRQGGRILAVAACEEGTGGPEFSRMLREHSDPERYLKAIEHADVMVDQWQLEKLAMVMRKARISYCVPGLDQDTRGSLWGRAFADISEAVRDLFDGLPAGARVAVIPEGPYVLAKVARAA